MTRTVIWETDANREQYADTPCDVCLQRPAYHPFTLFGEQPHEWRIYREAETHAEKCVDASECRECVEAEAAARAPAHDSDTCPFCNGGHGGAR